MDDQIEVDSWTADSHCDKGLPVALDIAPNRIRHFRQNGLYNVDVLGPVPLAPSIDPCVVTCDAFMLVRMSNREAASFSLKQRNDTTTVPRLLNRRRP